MNTVTDNLENDTEMLTHCMGYETATGQRNRYRMCGAADDEEVS